METESGTDRISVGEKLRGQNSACPRLRFLGLAPGTRHQNSGERASLFQSGRVSFENEPNPIPHLAKLPEDFLLRPFGMRGVIETPMMPVHLPRKDRTGLIGIATDGDDRGDFLAQKIVHVLRGVIGDIDADFLEHLDGFRMHIAGRLRTRAMNFHKPADSGV